MTAEAKVGMFFLTALLLVGVIALYLGDFWVRARSYPVTAYFENVQGLASGADVRFAGVKVGRVTSVTLSSTPKFPTRPAAVKMAIFHDITLYDDDQFTIQQSALLGDKYVEVRRTVAPHDHKLAAGAEVLGGTSTGIGDMTDEMRTLVREARATLAAVRGTFASDYNKQMLRQILGNVAAASAKADRLGAQALQLAGILTRNVAKAGPDVAAMAANLRAASLSVKNTAQLVRTMLATSTVPRDAALATGNIRKATEDMTAISGNLAQVFATPETRAKLQDALDDLHQSMQHLAAVSCQAEKLFGDDTGGKDIRETLTRLREAATNVSNITATYDKLLTDPAFTTDVRQTVTSARHLVECGAQAMQRADKSLARVDETMGRVTKATRVFSPDEVRTSIAMEGGTKSALRADMKVDLQYGWDRQKFVRLGIRDVGDAETVIFQKGFPVGRNVARAGIYGNKAGVGFDLNPQGKLGVETELWDPNDLRLDLRGVWAPQPRFNILFGFNDVTDDTDPFIGVRYHTNP